MIGDMVGVISRVGIFMVCAQTVVHCRPKPVYEKYLKLLVSLIVLVLLWDGISAWFRKGASGTQNDLSQWEDWLLEEDCEVGEIPEELWPDESGEWTEETEKQRKIEIPQVQVEPIELEVMMWQ